MCCVIIDKLLLESVDDRNPFTLSCEQSDSIMLLLVMILAKKKTGKDQVEESYQPGNIGSMAGTIPSVKKGERKKKR